MAFATMNFFSKSLKRTIPFNIVIPTDKILPGEENEKEKKTFSDFVSSAWDFRKLYRLGQWNQTSGFGKRQKSVRCYAKRR